ncbi:6-phosphogluconolactonase [Pseudomonas cavernae]|uniref:6-phosphogluconolactonase n=1 Tax=Pseudomonas cavernae TaxID=2320867 RepID=A0A385Z483_9PSED|nr:6-phosphogluconolactonase [Pseudomonas cavernae]AYC33544.1 6-phosphogluconolactonase [Pseudomonas cavernae]
MNSPLLLSFPGREDCVSQLAVDLAAQLRQALATQARASLLLPGGSSPQTLLPQLREQTLDWARVYLSPTDERWVPSDDPQSNWRLLQAGLPQAASLDPRQAATAEAAVSAWTRQLADWRPFAAVLLGMGEDGHFASLFPEMLGLAAALDPQAVPAAVLGLAPSEPRQRLSLNLAMLCDSAWLGLLAFGEGKRRLLDAVLADQPHSRAWPVHALAWQGRQSLRIYWAP